MLLALLSLSVYWYSCSDQQLNDLIATIDDIVIVVSSSSVVVSFIYIVGIIVLLSVSIAGNTTW